MEPESRAWLCEWHRPLYPSLKTRAWLRIAAVAPCLSPAGRCFSSCLFPWERGSPSLPLVNELCC